MQWPRVSVRWWWPVLFNCVQTHVKYNTPPILICRKQKKNLVLRFRFAFQSEQKKQPDSVIINFNPATLLSTCLYTQSVYYDRFVYFRGHFGKGLFFDIKTSFWWVEILWIGLSLLSPLFLRPVNVGFCVLSARFLYNFLLRKCLWFLNTRGSGSMKSDIEICCGLRRHFFFWNERLFLVEYLLSEERKRKNNLSL